MQPKSRFLPFAAGLWLYNGHYSLILSFNLTNLNNTIMSKPKGKPRELPEEGSHDAICKIVADLGTQQPKNEGWNATRKILFLFELVNESTKDHPVYQTKEVTFTPKSKNLATILKSWLQVKNTADFDCEDCLNKAATLTISHSDDGQWANIETVTPLKGKVAKGFIKPVSVFLDETYDADAFESLPEWIKNKIIDSPEFEEVSAPKKKKKK